MIFIVTIDHTKVSANLTDFPVYVDLSDMPGGFWSTVTNGGGDIRCYASDGTTQLPREVVSCDTSTSTGELHIRTNVSSSTDTVLKIHVDGIGTEPSASSTYGSQNVWTNNYTSVYHLAQDPSGSAPQSDDSTSNGYNGTSSGTWSSGDLVAGKVSKGLAFNGTNHTIAASTSAVPTGTAARTTSIWANQTSSANAVAWAFGTAAESELWEMMVYNDNLIWHGYGGGMDTISISAPISTGVWNHLVLTYSGSAVGVYVNGAFMGSYTVAINTTQSINNIGGPGYFSRWNGALDEARLSSVARSADWIATEYSNQNSPSVFYSIAGAAPMIQGVASITGISSIQF